MTESIVWTCTVLDATGIVLAQKQTVDAIQTFAEYRDAFPEALLCVFTNGSGTKRVFNFKTGKRLPDQEKE